MLSSFLRNCCAGAAHLSRCAGQRRSCIAGDAVDFWYCTFCTLQLLRSPAPSRRCAHPWPASALVGLIVLGMGHAQAAQRGDRARRGGERAAWCGPPRSDGRESAPAAPRWRRRFGQARSDRAARSSGNRGSTSDQPSRSHVGQGQGPRHRAQFAAQDVDELRQFVESGRAQSAPDPIDAPVAHGAKLADGEGTTSAAETLLAEQHRPPVLQQDRKGDDGH